MLKSNISINTFIDFKCYNIDKPRVNIYLIKKLRLPKNEI